MLRRPEIAYLEATLKNETVVIDEFKISCNLTCCEYSENEIICFGDYNYTDRNNLTYTAGWELGVRWTYTILVTLMAILGNVCIIIILMKNRLLLRTSVNHFILNMSVADLIMGVAGPIPFTIRDTNNFWVLGETWCHLEGYIQTLVMLVSVTSLATISFDRMVGVVYPFHQHFKRWQSVGIIIFIWAASALLATPWAIYRVYTVHIWNDLTQKICGEHENIRVWWIVGTIALNWLPLSIMVVSYTTIMVYFHHRRFRNACRKEHPIITHLKKRVVKMMFVVVIILTVCWLPLLLLQITINNFLDDYGQFKDDATEARYNCFLTVAQYMIYINPAVNPIVYAFMHQTFQRAFRVTFPFFYKGKSSLVLTRGHGMRRYMWSVRSITSNCSVLSTCPRGSVSRQEGGPQAVLSSSTNGASMTFKMSKSEEGYVRSEQSLDPDPKKYEEKTRSVGPEPNIDRISKNMKGKMSSLGPKFSLDSKAETTQASWSSEGHVYDGSREESIDISIYSSLTFVNEGYVQDLLPKKISIIRTCAFSNLVHQVIEEESSSDIENEHIL